MLAREWRSTASNARARTTQSLRGTSVGDRLMSLQEPFRGPRCSTVCSKSSISISRQFLGGIANMFANLGLLALRLTLGLVFLGHGAQKAFGSFGGPGFAGATGFIGSLGLRPARFWAALAVAGELLAGALLAGGVLAPLAALLVLGTMGGPLPEGHRAQGGLLPNGG